MKENPRYILTQDTDATFSRIRGDIKSQASPAFTEAVDGYLASVTSSLGIALNNKVNVQTYSEFQIEEALQNRVLDELKVDRDAVCICLDRFLLGNMENSDIYKERFFRFEIRRSFDGEKVPRQGSVPFLEQLENLKQAIPELDKKQLIVVDSGVFSGGTVKEFLKLLSTKDIKAPVKKIICFVSDHESLKNSSLIPLEVIEPVKDLYDWVDVRDFSPFGGKVLSASRNNGASSSIPYLYPWSDGSDASLDKSPHLFIVSQSMIKAFRELVVAYDRGSGNKPLTFRELVKNGLPLPTNSEKNIPISINTSVIEYLDLCSELIEAEQKRQVAILDMDGTLYQLDGNNNGYRGSTLDKVVHQNARAFIKAKEKCSNDQVSEVLQAGLADPIGLSAYLSRKYGISRLEYFNDVWDISPEGIIKNGEKTQEIIASLKRNPQLKFVLLTSSPRVWTSHVLKYLGVDKFFESIYTGDQYEHKEEIFTLLAGRYKPENIISIGDQYQTDIEPAQKMGMRTLQVKTPRDLGELLNIL